MRSESKVRSPGLKGFPQQRGDGEGGAFEMQIAMGVGKSPSRLPLNLLAGDIETAIAIAMPTLREWHSQITGFIEVNKGLYMVARNFFLLLLNCSAWPRLAVA